MTEEVTVLKAKVESFITEEKKIEFTTVKKHHKSTSSSQSTPPKVAKKEEIEEVLIQLLSPEPVTPEKKEVEEDAKSDTTSVESPYSLPSEGIPEILEEDNNEYAYVPDGGYQARIV